MIYPMLGVFFLICLWIGVELSAHNVVALVLFIMLGALALQLGFFLGVHLRK